MIADMPSDFEIPPQLSFCTPGPQGTFTTPAEDVFTRLDDNIVVARPGSGQCFDRAYGLVDGAKASDPTIYRTDDSADIERSNDNGDITR